MLQITQKSYIIQKNYCHAIIFLSKYFDKNKNIQERLSN